MEKLNADIGNSVADLQSYVKDFELKVKLYKSLFKGKGVDFDGYRDYAPGDDASVIDWKASKRSNSVLVKQYIEEKNAKITFAVDVSKNMLAGSTSKLKAEYNAEVVASLTYLMLKSGYKVGFILFGDEVVNYFEPSKKMDQFFLIIDYLTNPENYRGRAKYDKMIDYILNNTGKNDAIILVSDFIDFDKSFESKLGLLANNTEILALMIRDPLDNSLPNYNGEIVFEDPISNEQVLVNPSIAKNIYDQESLRKINEVKEIMKNNRIDILPLASDSNFAYKLSEFLKERVRG